VWSWKRPLLRRTPPRGDRARSSGQLQLRGVHPLALPAVALLDHQSELVDDLAVVGCELGENRDGLIERVALAVGFEQGVQRCLDAFDL